MQQARRQILDNPEPAVALVVAWRRGKGYDFGRVRTAEAFTHELGIVADAAEHAIATRHREAYSIGDEIDDDEYMVAQIPQAEGVPEAREGDGNPQRPARSTNPADPREFRRRLVTTGGMASVGRRFLEEAAASFVIAFYAIVRGVDVDDRIAYVRHLNPLRLAKPGNILATLGQTLSRLTHPVFALDDRIDLVLRPNRIDILDKTFFDGLFFSLSGQDERLDRIVEETLATLPIQENTLAALVERARGRKRARRKMLEIQHSGHLATVTMVDFRRALAEDGLEEGRFIDAGGSIYADENDSDLLLEILNEDIFKGALTGRRLAASRKRVAALRP